MRNLHELLQATVKTRFFREPLPFRAHLQPGHDKLCVITGPNVSGKSLVRKILHNLVADDKVEYMPLSQEGRCSSGIQRGFIYGYESEKSTGHNSVTTLKTLGRTGQGRDNPFVVMYDEPEIGCGEELQLAVGQRIASMIDTMPKLVAFFVITHSRMLIRPLLALNPTHLRLGGDTMSLKEWGIREVFPVDLDALAEEGHQRWLAVSKAIDENKKQKR